MLYNSLFMDSGCLCVDSCQELSVSTLDVLKRLLDNQKKQFQQLQANQQQLFQQLQSVGSRLGNYNFEMIYVSDSNFRLAFRC